MLSGVFLKSIGLCLISESSSDVELHLGDNYIAVADLAQILQNRKDVLLKCILHTIGILKLLKSYPYEIYVCFYFRRRQDMHKCFI